MTKSSKTFVGYRTTVDILIPVGTTLYPSPENRGGSGYVECVVGHGKDFASVLLVQVHDDAETSGYFRRIEHEN